MIDVATERALLGSILLDNGHYFEIAERAVPEDFSLDSHRRIFRRMGEILASGRSIDTLSLPAELARHCELESIGRYGYLSELTTGLPRKSAVTEWIETLLRGSRETNARRLIADLQVRVDDPSTEVDELIAYGASEFIELQPQTISAQGNAAIVPLLDRMEAEHTRTGELLGLPSGLDVLDSVTRGMQAADLILVGARTSVGKSAFMVQGVIANCRAGNPVLVFSLEMTPDQVYRRIFSIVSGVPFLRCRDPKWASAEEMSKIRHAAEQVADWPLVIDPSGALHIEQMMARARHAVLRKGVKVVFVDYAQIVRADGRDERLRVAAVSRGCTALAKDEGIPVVLLSQLSRPDKSNPHRRPRLSDLRETSQLENDASVALLLHRPVDEEENMGDDAEIIIAKQRNGATGLQPLTFNPTTLTFIERRSVAGTRTTKSAGKEIAS